jgi:hypothetical protein
VLDIVLFRHAPHFLKKVIYNGERWLIQPLLTRETDKLNLRYFSHKAFLNEIIKKGSANRSNPVYKYLHLMLTHSPVVVNEKCEYAENIKATRKNRRTQARCTLDQFIEFLNKLKQMGIYDSSLIILHADHGAGQKVKMKNIDRQMDTVLLSRMESLSKIAGSAIPLLAVKPPFSKGALKISEAQVELTDIPQTISSILDLNEKFDGQSIFDMETEKVRERKFYNYKWRSYQWQSEYFDHLDEFIITGSVFDMASWQLGLTYHSPKFSYKTQKIDFGTEESNRFKRSGWSANKRNPKKRYTFNWAKGNTASIFLSLPKQKAVTLTANIRSMAFKKPQQITIKVDNKEIGRWELFAPWKIGKYSIVIRPDEQRGDVSVVEFIFSQHLTKDNKKTETVLFESISLTRSK